MSFLSSCSFKKVEGIPEWPARLHKFEVGVEGRERCLDEENASLYAQRELLLKEFKEAVEEVCQVR